MAWSDSQRGKAYDAECVLSGFQTRAFETEVDIRKYVHRITTSRWFAKRFRFGTDHRAIHVDFNPRLRRTASGGGRAIHLPNRHCWAWCERVILHEIAHCASSGAHGASFCRAFLALVEKYMGSDAHRELRRSFAAANMTLINDKAHDDSAQIARILAHRAKHITWRIENGRWIAIIEADSPMYIKGIRMK